MDGDVQTRFEQMIAELQEPDDLPTLMRLNEALEVQITTVQGNLMFDWFSQGWRPNAPGLTCRRCGGHTWGKQVGRRELVKCVSLTCGVTREVMV